MENNKESILVVDDEPALLKMAGEILSDDYDVSIAKSGKEALMLLKDDFMPSIILLDITMPKMDGFETLFEIRKLEDMEDVPVVFLTAENTIEFQLKGLTYGAVDYITKPFIKEILLARLKIHLENGKRLRQLSVLEKKKNSNDLLELKSEYLKYDLTEIEEKVLNLILLGFSNIEIADEIQYSYNYARKIVSVIYEKIGVKKRSELRKLYNDK